MDQLRSNASDIYLKAETKAVPSAVMITCSINEQLGDLGVDQRLTHSRESSVMHQYYNSGATSF